MEIVLFQLSFLKKTDLCLPLPQELQKTLANESKH